MPNQLVIRTWSTILKKYVCPRTHAHITESGVCKPTAHSIIERWTGLKDSNGKRIFEGDIVLGRWKHEKTFKPHPKRRRFSVYWNDTYGQWELEPLEDSPNGFFTVHPFVAETKVVGSFRAFLNQSEVSTR